MSDLASRAMVAIEPSAMRATELAAGLRHAATMSDRAVLLVRSGDPSRVAWANDTAVHLLTRDGSTIVGLPLAAVLTWTTTSPLLHSLRVQRRNGRLHSADGTSHPVTVTAHPVPGHDLWTLSAAPEAGTRAPSRSDTVERRLVALTERTPVPTVLSDVGLRLAHVNDAFARLFAVPVEAVLGLGWLQYVHPDDLDIVTTCAQRALQGAQAEALARILPLDGGQRWLQLRLAPAPTGGLGPGFVGTAEDVTERRALEQRLSYQAGHDALTGLANRAALFEHLAGALARRALPGGDATPHVTVLFLDLDNFKVINDSLGHDAGDTVLVDLAVRLQSAVRDDDLVTRMGGDEFVVVCHQVADDAEAEVLARRVLAVCTEPLTVGSVLVHPSASMGVVRASAAHTGPQDLLRDADIAMYEAKAQGKNRFAICDDETRTRAGETLHLLADLRRAIGVDGVGDGSLTLAFQPVLDLAAAAGPGPWLEPLPAVEALSRWTHPQRGDVAPEVFVALAEEHRLIDALTARVLDTSCAQLARWRAELGGLAPRQVNVNVSAQQLPQLHLVTTVEQALARHGLPAEALCLEITETAIMVDPAASRTALLALRALGVTVAIDDFGVGYSSLAQLRRLPVDHVKIDRSFVAEIGTSDGGALAQAVVSLGSALGLTAIAEGVENPFQAAELRRLGCTLAQGWLWSAALPADDLRDWVLARAAARPAEASAPPPRTSGARESVR